MNSEKRLQSRREAVRAMILDAARDILIREGPNRFSMRNLAEKIGYSPGTIYLYFESKENLLDRLVDEGFDKLLEVLDAVHDSADSVQSLTNKLHAYVDFGRRFPTHYHFAFVMRPTGRAVTVPTKPHASFDVLRKAVRRCIDQGQFRSPDVETTSQVLWATIHGITSLLITLPKFPWVDREVLVERAIGTTIDGLRRAPVGGGRSGGDHDD
jgi:AcrR family transcriptional regulator